MRINKKRNEVIHFIQELKNEQLKINNDLQPGISKYTSSNELLKRLIDQIEEVFIDKSDLICTTLITSLKQRHKQISEHIKQHGGNSDFGMSNANDFLYRFNLPQSILEICDILDCEDQELLSIRENLSPSEKEYLILSKLNECSYKDMIDFSLLCSGLGLKEAVIGQNNQILEELKSEGKVISNQNNARLTNKGLKYLEDRKAKRLKNEYYIEEGLTEAQVLRFEKVLLKYKDEVKEHIDDKFKEQAELIKLCNSILDELCQETINQAIKQGSKKSIMHVVLGFLGEKILDQTTETPIKETVNYMWQKFREMFGEEMFQKLQEAGFDKLLN